MAKCAVVGCNSIYNPFHGDISFHRITKNKKYLPLWEQVVKLRTDSTNAKICNLHFREKDFIKGREKRVLKLSAVPSVNVTDMENDTDDEDDNENLSTLKKVLTAKNSRSVRNGKETPGHEDVHDSNVSQKFEMVMSCCNTAQSTDPRNAKQTNNMGVQTNIKSDKEISLQARVKQLGQRLRRRDAKISHMKTVLNMIKKHIKGTDMEYKLCCELQNISEVSEVNIVKDGRKNDPNKDVTERTESPFCENEDVESSGDEAGMFVEVVHSPNLKISNGFSL